MSEADKCWTCHRPRGIAQLRKSWWLSDIVHVPTTNDLVCSAGVVRNGGTDEETHLCDDCLRIGLRALYTRIGTLLGEMEPGLIKDTEIASLTAKLAHERHGHYLACFEHNRMQDRLEAVLLLKNPRGEPGAPAEATIAWWEVDRGHIGLDTL